MIEEPPLLTLKEHCNRPRIQQIEALRDTPTGFLTDAMNVKPCMLASKKAVSFSIS